LMDVSKLHSFGWRHRIGLEEGIRSVYSEYAQKLQPAL
jgi:GDP-L-fucose synthase